MPAPRAATFEPVTLAHIRAHGCRDLLIYCDSGRCHHSATMNADWLPDETPVRSLRGRMVCTCRGYGPCEAAKKPSSLSERILDWPLRTEQEAIALARALNVDKSREGLPPGGHRRVEQTWF